MSENRIAPCSNDIKQQNKQNRVKRVRQLVYFNGDLLIAFAIS